MRPAPLLQNGPDLEHACERGRVKAVARSVGINAGIVSNDDEDDSEIICITVSLSPSLVRVALPFIHRCFFFPEPPLSLLPRSRGPCGSSSACNYTAYHNYHRSSSSAPNLNGSRHLLNCFANSVLIILIKGPVSSAMGTCY